MNLTGTWRVSGVLIEHDANRPDTVNVEVWNGTAWTPGRVFVVSTTATFAIYSFDANYTGTAVRVTGNRQWGLYEARPIGSAVLAAVTPPVDYTLVYLLLVVFLVLVALGFAWHPIHILAGIAGLALAFELFTTTGDSLLSIIVGALGLLVIVLGFTGRD